jgi:predicted PurR-regulated permease PerM
MLSERDFTRRMLQTVFAVAGIAILLATLWAVREALLLIYVSGLIAMGFSPLVRDLERSPKDHKRRLPRWFAILVLYVTLIAIFVLVALIVIPPLIAQATALWAKVPDEFDRLQSQLIRYKLMRRRITIAEAVQNAPSGSTGDAVGTVLVAVSSFAGGVFGLITVLILSFYFLIEARTMFEYLIRFVPEHRRADVSIAAREAVVKVSASLRAQVTLAGVMGVFAAVGLGYMGVPYFFVVALVAAMGETIPIVGPIIGGVTAIGVALTVSPQLALTVGVYFFVLHQLEANVLVPKIMERRVGVSPVAVMIALLVGGALSGIIGAILAIPSAAIISVIIEDIAVHRGPHRPAVHVPGGRDSAV